MPTNDADEKLFNILNPAGIIAGYHAGVKPMLRYALEYPSEKAIEIVKMVYDLDTKLMALLNVNTQIVKDKFIKDYNNEVAKLVIEVATVDAPKV